MALREGIRNRLGNKTLACCVICGGRLLGALPFIVYAGGSAHRNNGSTGAMDLVGPGERQLMAEFLGTKGVIREGGRNRGTIRR